MNRRSAKTLVWIAVITLLLGMTVASPAGSFFLYSIAALSSLIPVIFSNMKTRITAALMLSISLILLAVTYPEYSTHMTQYKEHVRGKTSEKPYQK